MKIDKKKTQMSDLHIRISGAMDEKLHLLASEWKTCKSDAARRLIWAGLKSQGYVRDEDYMYNLVSEALDKALEKPVERLAAISAKTAQSSGAGIFFMSWLAKEILQGSPSAQNKIEEAFSDAHALGVRFLKLSKDGNASNFLEQGVKNMTEKR